MAAESQNRLDPQLRDARKMELDNLRYFVEAEFLVVVKVQNGPFNLRHSLDGSCQDTFQLGSFHYIRRPILAVIRGEAQEAGLLPVFSRILEPLEVDSLDCGEPLLIFGERQLQFPGDFLFGSFASPSLFGSVY